MEPFSLDKSFSSHVVRKWFYSRTFMRSVVKQISINKNIYKQLCQLELIHSRFQDIHKVKLNGT